MKLKLKIIDLHGIYFQGEVDLLNIVTSSGEITILANHLPLISSINISHMYYKNDGVITTFAIAGGTLFVDEHECKIITPAIESSSEIDFLRALKAKERAEHRLNNKDENTDIKRAEVALQRALNRLSFNK
ncbi:MAG: ATP synthase F1 subunit epsilon [Erysipelotrichaceae bacterium]|nr:ATP synthase F1 subunit epsilon [Erysipelotrichaceae bacterium]